MDNACLSNKLPPIPDPNPGEDERKVPDHEHAHPYPAFLTFVAAPNANRELGRNSYSTTRRTFNRTMANNYHLFREGVKNALRAGLDAMIQNGIQVAVIPKLGCGIYAGPHQARIISEYTQLVREVLQEQVHPHPQAPRT